MTSNRSMQRIANHTYGIKAARAKKEFRCEMEIIKTEYNTQKQKLSKNKKKCSDEKLKDLQDEFMEQTEKIQKILADEIDNVTLEWHETSISIEGGGSEI